MNNLFYYRLGQKSAGGTGGGGSGGGESWIGDGNTHIWISLSEGRTSPMLSVCPNGTVTVDWGDGTTPDVLTGTSTSTIRWTPTHNYAAAGDYVITLTVDGEMGFYATSTNYGILRAAQLMSEKDRCYRNAINKIEIGNNVVIYAYSLQGNASLESLVIPGGTTELGANLFGQCSSLKKVTIPNGVTTIGDAVFNSCYSLKEVTIPNSVTSIGTSLFSYCHNLKSVVIPDGVTSIGSSFFSNCQTLPKITIPKSVTSIGNAAFMGCYSLSSITIPNSVTSIGNYAFYTCYSLAKLRFDSATPPTVDGSSAFSNVPADCVISVPVGSLAAYTTATNYPSSSKYTYIEED